MWDRGLGLYILDGHRPVFCADVLKWGRWMQTQNIHVAETMIDKVRVSTVFLGLDHGFPWLERPKPYVPILFETMVFGGPLHLDQERYPTWNQAEAGHREMVMRVRGHRSVLPFKTHREVKRR